MSTIDVSWTSFASITARRWTAVESAASVNSGIVGVASLPLWVTERGNRSSFISHDDGETKQAIASQANPLSGGRRQLLLPGDLLSWKHIREGDWSINSRRESSSRCVRSISL